MKDKKKYKAIEHSDGSTTYSPTTGVGFYNPFLLVKKDFKITSVHDSIRPIVFFIKILQSISQDNRITTAQLKSISSDLDISEMTISRLLKNLTECNLLIKISRGIYKVNEGFAIFKQDHEGYLALQKETKSLTQNNTTNNITNNIIVSDEKTLREILLERHDENVRKFTEL